MFRRWIVSSSAAVALGGVMVLQVPVAAQAPAKPAQKTVGAGGGAAKKYVPKRLPWGDPDLSGNFTTKDEANTPFERPDEFAGKRLEDVTAAELDKANEQRRRRALADAPFPGGGSPSLGVAIAVPIHWFDSLDTQNSRPWFVVDPPDGKVPPLTEDGKTRLAALAAARAARGTADSYTDRSTGDRCIGSNLPPGRVVPTLYGNSHHILQTKDYVVIRHEMYHESRVIPIEGRGAARPHRSQNLRTYWGDAIARWEGDTLVVDNTNLNGKIGFRGSSERLHTIERFTRVAPNKLEWSATLEDPGAWTRPWTFAITWTEDDTQPIFEYACHEGNYAMRNILSAGRSDDRKGIKSSDSVDTQADLKQQIDE